MPIQRKTTAQFVIEAQSVHGDKYDYSEAEYNRGTLTRGDRPPVTKEGRKPSTVPAFLLNCLVVSWELLIFAVDKHNIHFKSNAYEKENFKKMRVFVWYCRT